MRLILTALLLAAAPTALAQTDPPPVPAPVPAPAPAPTQDWGDLQAVFKQGVTVTLKTVSGEVVATIKSLAELQALTPEQRALVTVVAVQGSRGEVTVPVTDFGPRLRVEMTTRGGATVRVPLVAALKAAGLQDRAEKVEKPEKAEKAEKPGKVEQTETTGDQDEDDQDGGDQGGGKGKGGKGNGGGKGK